MLWPEEATENDDAAALAQHDDQKDIKTTLTEVPEKRTAYSKEFLMGNGLHMAAVYDEPVHYYEDGAWREIDNTLKLSNNRSENVYTNTAGIWQVLFPQNMTPSNGVSIIKDGYTMNFRMSGELHINPGNGEVLSADEQTMPNSTPDLTEVSGEDTGENTAEANDVLTSENEIPKSSEEDILALIGASDEISLTQPIAQSTAVIVPVDSTVYLAEDEYSETVADKLYSRLEYADIYENTDFIFELHSTMFKESVVLGQYDASLYGYTYLLNVGEMIPLLKETGEIEVYDAQGENLIMIMPAPYLVDNAGTCNYSVNVNLVEANGMYILSYLLPQEWLAESDREWPVVLDPAVMPSLDSANIRDVTISTGGYVNYMDQYLHCGYNSSNTSLKLSHIYVKYTNLPALTSSDVVVSATMRMFMLESDYASGKPDPVVEVHKVTGPWESESITLSNAPAANPTVEDYAVVSEFGQHFWDVTDIVRDWYEDENTGLMFKLSDAAEAQKNLNIIFHSSDNTNYLASRKPGLTVIFRSNNGLEGYWDYTTSSAGRAGTGYVNQYTGNLVWIRNDIGFGGNRMPVSISHVYNTNDSNENLYGMGNGWRTNFNQTVYRWNHENAYGDYYVWEDSDGTDHYFYNVSAGTYKDEDGLELTLTTTGSGTKKYCISDKNGNASYFDTHGRLTQQSNNQATKSNITITYTTTSGKLISTITDGAGRVYAFTYNTANLLSQIAYKGYVTPGTNISTIPSITYIDFGYTNSNLTAVTDKDGKTSNYSYTTNNLLSAAQDIDGYKICYDYTTTTAGQPNRIKTVSEYSGTTAGGVLNIEYAHNQTKFKDYNDNIQIVQFNNMGNTISVQDDMGRAQYAQYAINDPHKQEDTTPASTNARSAATAKGNQLLLASKLQNTVGNLLKDSSFESSTLWTATSSSVTRAIDTTNSYMGSQSLKMVRSSAGTAAGLYSTAFTVASGETYTFSAYVKTGTGTAYLALHDGGTTVVSETLAANSGWTRLEVSYTNTSSAAKSVTARLMTAAAGTTYMDCAQVEKAPTASRYNLIENGDFTYSGYAWNTSSGRTTVAAANKAPAPQLDINVYKMTGNPSGQNRISQTVKVSGASGDTFVLAGWARADSVPIKDNREFALIATFKNGSTVVNTSIVRFNYCADSTIDWQYAASPIVASGTYDSIVVELAYDYNANTVYFDGVQLYKEEFGNSYTYDANGNIISVKDVQSQTTTYEYTNNDLTKQTLPSGAALTYTYDTYHNVETATSDTGVVYSFDYDAYGNNTSVSIVSGSVALTSSAAYTSDGNRLSSTTDAAGKVTTYSYDENTNILNWVKYPEDTTATRTEYSYDSMYRLAKAEADISTGSTLFAQYQYENDLLKSITTASTTYTFNYGPFALRSDIKIGNRTLASYDYTSRNNFLASLDYGNGDSVDYTYDKQGRVTKQTYEDGKTVTYKYDNNGALASITDSATGITTTYYYDYTDRLMRYAEKGSNHSYTVGYEYDNINNLTALVETINGESRTTEYTYDDDNRLTNTHAEFVHTGGENPVNVDVDVSISYDAFGRIATVNNGAFTRTYNYHTTTSGGATSQLASFSHNGIHSTYAYEWDYSYEYDDNGNITAAVFGNRRNTYVYDSANQLIRENNDRRQYTQVWEYDDAGNIVETRKYTYTTGELGTLTQQIKYEYDTEWGDLLTKYNGQTVTHDEIGNMTSDGTWTYTWEHGRQLKEMSNGTTTWTYTYDANGMRTIRSNGTDTYKYYYNGDQLTRMVKNGEVVDITYSAGQPATMSYDGATYYYVLNGQGDVIGLTDSNGNMVIGYTYGAYGVVTALVSHQTLSPILWQVNPLTYRGYVYDRETTLYYLQSRYYDPELGRFINADALVSTGQGILGNNMFAYCANNPIIHHDKNGEFPWLIFGIIVGAGILGGILGYSSEENLGADPPDNLPTPRNELKHPSEITETDLVQPESAPEEPLSTSDRIYNAFLGATLGIAVGGLVVSGTGAVVTVATGSAATYIPVLGATAKQTFVIGALAYDVIAMLFAPLLGVEMETIEVEPE